EVARIPYSPVFALFAEQSPGGRPGVWHRAGTGSSDSFPRLRLLYPHDYLLSSAFTLSRQEKGDREASSSVLSSDSSYCIHQDWNGSEGEGKTWGASRL